VFLESLQAEIEAYVSYLHSFSASLPESMPITARLALQLGIDGYECHARWAKSAMAELRRVRQHDS